MIPRQQPSSEQMIQIRELVAATAQSVHNDIAPSYANEEAVSSVRCLAEKVHAEACSQLMNGYNDTHIAQATVTFRAVEDTQTVIRTWAGVRTLLKSLNDTAEPISTTVTRQSERHLLEMIQRTDCLIAQVASALCQTENPLALAHAATAIQGVQQFFKQAESDLKQTQKQWNCSRYADLRTFQRISVRCRMIHAALWSLMVCAESIARIAARLVITGETESRANVLNPFRTAPLLPV